MIGYEFTPYALPALAAAALVTALGVYAWCRRSLPGAVAFVWMAFLAVPWLLGEVLMQSTVSASTKIFWFKFQLIWLLPMATAAICFALEYANLGAWLNPVTLALLALPPALTALAIATNGARHLFWLELSVFNGPVGEVRGTVAYVFAFYGLLLTLTNLFVFVWLFVRSAPHRRPAALCLCGYIVVRIGMALDLSGRSPLAPMTATTLGGAFLFLMYSLVLFRFRMLDTLSFARRTVIEQMDEGLLVLDPQRRVVDMNAAAERALGVAARRVVGQRMSRFIAPGSPLAPLLDSIDHKPFELRIQSGDLLCVQAVERLPLAGPRRLPLGEVFLLHDVTEQRRAQEQFDEQQRALAVLEERDRIGRELHDNLGQVLGYLKIQLHTAGELLLQGQASAAHPIIAQAGAAAHEAHADVREYIQEARSAVREDAGFLAALQTCVQQFGERHEIATKLHVVPGFGDGALDSVAGAHMLRILQEALRNVRKHGEARSVFVSLDVDEGQVRAAVEDDGVGFDLAARNGEAWQSSGLGFMRQRAESLGGDLRIHSAPGHGTRVQVSMPLRKVPS